MSEEHQTVGSTPGSRKHTRQSEAHQTVASASDSSFNEVATASDRRRKLVSDSDSLFSEVATASDRRRKHIRQWQAPPTAYSMKSLLLPINVGKHIGHL